MKKVFSVYGVISFLLAAFIFLFNFSSCDVGLGESVDTTAPVIAITYPPSGSVIRDQFVLAGTCEDDKGVASMNIVVTNNETQKVWTYSNVSINGKTWNISLNGKSDEKWTLPDGKYTVDVTGTDSSGRTSGKSSRSFEIDNTAPMFFVSGPSSNVIANSTKYGSIFKVTGTITEDHSVKSMKVHIYNSSKVSLAEWTENNIEITGGTSVTFAKYDESAPSKETHTRYTSVYDTTAGGNQSYYCTITLEDSAKQYTVPVYEDKTVTNETNGNITACLWLNDAVRDNLESAASGAIANLEPSDIKSIWNGTYSGSSVDSETQAKVIAFLNTNKLDTTVSSEETSKPLGFTLNKDASPKYSFVGYGFTGIDAGSHKSSKNAAIGFTATSGLNETTFYPKTLKVMLFGPLEKTELTTSLIEKVYSDTANCETEYEALGKAQILKDFASEEASTSSGTSFTKDVSLPDNIESGKYYLLAATGTDTSNFDFVPNSQYFGFLGQASGTAPELILSSPVEDSLSNDAATTLVYTGTSKSVESNIASVTYEVTVYDLLNYDSNNTPKVVGKITGSGTADDGAFDSHSESWKFKISEGTASCESGYTSCMPATGNLYKYTAVITTTDVPGLYSTGSKNVTIDMLAPAFGKVSISPVADSTNKKINGKVTLSGSITERNPKTTTLTVTDGTTSKSYGFADNTSIEQVVDTRDFADSKKLAFTLKSTDKAANETSTSLEYTIDQSTDVPVITSTGTLKDSATVSDWTKVTSSQNMFGSKSNNIFNVSVSDDDGLAAVYLKVYNESGKLMKSDGTFIDDDNSTYTKTIDTESAKNYALNYEVPSTQGNYKIVVTAKDTEFGTEKSLTYFIGVYDNSMLMKLSSASKSDNTAIAISNNEVVVAASADIKLTGSLSITSKDHVKTIKAYKMALSNGVWARSGDAVYDYTKDRTSGSDTISVTGSASALTWSLTVKGSNVVSGTAEQHFLFEAVDIYGNTASTELTCHVDDASEKPKFTNPSWSNSSKQTIKVWVKDTGSYVSGISSVKYSFGSDVKAAIELNAGQHCDESGSTSASTKDYTIYSLDDVNFAVSGASANSATGNGNTKVYVWAIDAVGNVSAASEITYEIDVTKPSKTSAAVTTASALAANKTFDVSYEFTDEKDSGDAAGTAVSGITKIEVIADGTTVLHTESYSNSTHVGTSTTTGSGDSAVTTWTPVTVSGIAISETSGSNTTMKLTDGTHTIGLRVTDGAGNVLDVSSIGSITVDTVKPVTKISTGVSGSLNGKIQIGGSVTDANVASSSVPVIYYSTTGTSSWTKLTLTDADGDSKTSTCDGSNWTADINTLDMNKTGTASEVYLYAEFTDAAGNLTSAPVSASASTKITIDQNTDRPLITLTNIKPAITTGTNADPNSINTNVVSGTISDDDGISKLYRTYTLYSKNSSGTETSASTTSEITVSGDGSWSVTMDSGTTNAATGVTTYEKEGVNSWTFTVKDTAGTTFTTGTSNLSGTTIPAAPYINSKLATSKISNTAAVTFSYDITAPVAFVKIGNGTKSTEPTTWDSTSSNPILGGSSNYLWVSVDITEAVGLGTSDSSVVLTLKGTKDKVSKAVTLNGTNTANFGGNVIHTYYFYSDATNKYGSAALSDFDNGSVQVIIGMTDSAGNYAQSFKNVTVDTEAPQVQIVSPTTSMSDAVTSAISVKGLVQDDGGSSITSVKYMIPTTDQKTLVTAGTIPSTGWKSLSTSASWEITFASGSDESSDSLIYYSKATDADSGSHIYPVTEVGTGTGIYKVPFYFKVSDSAGNTAVRTTDSSGNELYVLVDSEGGKPKSWISSPESGSTTSGDITVYGGASDDVSVTKVELMVNGDSSKVYTVSGTNSWKYTVASSGNTLTKTVSGNSVSYMTFAVRATDNDGNVRAWSDPVEVTIDGETPTIKNVKLVQKTSSSGTANVEREYISGMYISDASISTNGDWYLTADVADNQQVKSVSWTKLTTAGQTMIDINPTAVTSNTTATYTLNQKLDISGQSGQIYYVIKVSDNNKGEQTQTIKINVDSTAPSFYDTANAEKQAPADGKLRLKSKSTGNTLSTDETVANSNGYFTFGDVVGEAGSGLQYLAFYFQRTGTQKIYCPMYSSSNVTTMVSSAATGSVYLNSDKLPALKITATRSADDSIQSDYIKSNNNVRIGGLVKIGGIYSRILSVDSTNGIVTISPTCATRFTDAEIIYAQVVDHQVTESIQNSGTLLNDDGDGMCESISQLGSSYTWTGTVHSDYIPDGPVEIHAVAIDNAGNLSKGYTTTFVSNNRPRLTKVLLGTDLNASGKYDFKASSASQIVTSVDAEKATADKTSFGEFSYYSAINKVSGVSQYDVELASSDFKVISGLAVIPEFVGGNGSIGYVLKQTSDKTSTDYTAKQTGTTTALTAKATILNSTTDKGTYGLTNQISDKGALILSPTSNYVALTFWDQTEGTSQGTTSQWAHLMIPVTLMTSETEKPVPSITPFHWTSASDNSVLVNGSIAGHIELEGDWKNASGYSSGATSGVSDADPKVSGKIKVQGTITDNVRISTISVSVFGTSVSNIATYTSGSWTYSVPSSSVVTSFTVDSDDISQNGHTVAYTMVVDTEKAAVGYDKNIVVSATDWKSNASVSSTTQTTSTAKTNYYKMDVVPYVTEIVTRLSPFNADKPSVYARTAQGKYPVREGDRIQFKGYNIGTNTASVTVQGMSATTLSSVSETADTANYLVSNPTSGNTLNNTLVLTATASGSSGAKSGAITLSVSGIAALNNLNNNDAKGDYGTDSAYANSYNRQPNGVNNNNLTDDLSLDVWQFKDAAEPVNGKAERVTMKINPKTGIPGFSYANSVLYFNMPAYNSDGGNENAWGAENTTISGSQYSQIPVGMNYGGFSHNSFCFDDYGYSYGAAMCTDTQSAYASAFLQFFSRETPIAYNSYNQNMNYVNCANASRLDSSTMDLSGSGSNYTTNINRIQSISMDTSYSGGSTTAPSSSTPVYVYMAYYDDIVKQVRFRWGTVGGATDNIDGKNNSTNSDSFGSRIGSAYGLNDVVDAKYTGFAQSSKGDGATRPDYISDSYMKYSNTNNSGLPVQVIAQGTVSSSGTVNSAYQQSTTYKAGQYVAMCIVNKTTSSPVAVVFWSDGMKLYRAYNAKPTTSNTWTSSLIDSAGGVNVKCVADSAGGIHLAYYTSNGGNLKYAYLSSYSVSSVTPVTVDANGSVGTNCTIDVAKDASGNQVPYITYQLTGGVSTYNAKIAYRTDFTSSTYEGADSSDYYSNKWEISIVPTTSVLNNDTINVGVWRDSNGKAKAFTSNTYWKSADILKYGGTAGSSSFETVSNGVMNVGSPSIVYGNNTANPIVGYGIDSGAIEIGQKK